MPAERPRVGALLILRICHAFGHGVKDFPTLTASILHARATKTLDPSPRCIDFAGPCRLFPIGWNTLCLTDVVDALAARFDMRRCPDPYPLDEPEHKDTIYLSVVDAQGKCAVLH